MECEDGRTKAVLKLKGVLSSSCAFSPDGTLAVASDGTIKIWDTNAKKEKASFKGSKRFVSSLAFNHDATLLAWGSAENTITLWDLKNGEEKAILTGHDDRITALTFSPNGSVLASGSQDKTISLWVVKTGKETGTVKAHLDGVL